MGGASIKNVRVVCANCGAAVMRSRFDAARSQRNFCSLSCITNTAEQFWARVAIGSPNECWEWTGSRNPRRGGYGQVGWMGKNKWAHRVALSLTDGDWDSPLNVCHSCDNPPCCNPAHLWRGTDLQNTRDMDAKGRRRPRILRGEASVQAKLTDAAVREIRSSPARGVDLADKYNVTKTLISRVRKGRAWGHVQ